MSEAARIPHVAADADEAAEAADPVATTVPPASAVPPERASSEPRERASRSRRSTPAVRVEHLSKQFGGHPAVQDVSLTVPVGSFYGVVGPNGAGKTTLLSMIAGLLRPDAGSVELDGENIWTPGSDVRRRIGVLPDRFLLFDRLTGRQYLRYAGALRGMPSKLIKERTETLIDTFGLRESAHRLVADYSTGMAKKIALASAMIHGPRLLVLDEPFEGVDPVSAARITRLLKKFVAGGGTVLLSSHSMPFVQRTCDRVAVIVDGLVIASGTMKQVRAGKSLEERFLTLVDAEPGSEELAWLYSSSG